MKKLVLLADNTGSMASYQHIMVTKLLELATICKNKSIPFYGRTFNSCLSSKTYNNVSDLAEKYSATGGPTNIAPSVATMISSLTPKSGFVPEDKVLAIVITDGKDDSNDQKSMDFVKTNVELMEQAYRWDWLFVGTDSNAFMYSCKLGIKAGKTLQMVNNKDGFELAMSSLLKIVDNWYGETITGDEFFTKDDREKQQKVASNSSLFI